MNYFISGGCKNGKSMYAQNIAKEMSIEQSVPLYYVATMIPTDHEDRARIKRHLAERDGWGFETIEQGRNILEILEKADPKGAFLLDSVTALLSNEMFSKDGCDFGAGERLAKELCQLAEKTGNMVFVSDYIYSDAHLYDEYTENYRRALAHIDKELAKVCHKTIEVSFGHIYTYEGNR